jgi:septal ring factor EnvC (AmiA/AmiB activator)
MFGSTCDDLAFFFNFRARGLLSRIGRWLPTPAEARRQAEEACRKAEEQLKTAQERLKTEKERLKSEKERQDAEERRRQSDADHRRLADQLAASEVALSQAQAEIERLRQQLKSPKDPNERTST